jgi:UDP-2,4-diacetamido-2,4,6-trideoxy-beta-L-altropyranose hydrolase
MDQTKILLRVDASLHIGSGHVMRCLTLADALRAEGAQCIFICREHPGNLIAQIRQRGFVVHALPPVIEMNVSNQNGESQSIYESWLGVDWATDAEQSKVGAGETVADWLIVDHYALDSRWERTLRPLCRKLMVIDDLANRQHDCDLLLDQNLGREATDYYQLVPEDSKVLVGPHYALLRPEFHTLREVSLTRRTANPHLRHLLVSMGGVDQVDATSKVLEALKVCQLPTNLNITIVMGQHAPWLDKVKYLSAKMPVPTEIKCNIENMAQLMTNSDLAIGAAGSTSWERCCLGLPSLIGVIADNQTFIADSLQSAGAAKIFDINHAMTNLRELMKEILENKTELIKLIKNAANVTDGMGTNRVALKLITMSVWAKA